MNVVEKLNIARVGLKNIDSDILMSAIRQNKNLKVVDNVKSSLQNLRNIERKIFEDEEFFAMVQKEEDKYTLIAWDLILENSNNVEQYNKKNLTTFYKEYYYKYISSSSYSSTLKTYGAKLFKYMVDYIEETFYDTDEATKLVSRFKNLSISVDNFKRIIDEKEQANFIKFICYEFTGKYGNDVYNLYAKIGRDEELINVYKTVGYFNIQIPAKIPEETLMEIKPYLNDIQQNISKLEFYDVSTGYGGEPYKKVRCVLKTFLNNLKDNNDINDIRVFVKRVQCDILDISIDVTNFTHKDYLKVIYYDKYKEIFDKDIFCDGTENVITYALRENKKAFLRNILNINNIISLINEHERYSLLNYECIKNILNLNTLNEANIKYLLSKRANKFADTIYDKLTQEANLKLTLEEFKTLFEDENSFLVTIYKELCKKISRVDDRLRILKELPNNNISYIKHNDERTPEEISEILVLKLSKKSLSKWIKEDFSSIQDKLEKSVYLKILLYMDCFSKFINQLQTESDVSFIMLVKDDEEFMNKFDNLRDMQREYYENDNNFNAFLKQLDLSDEFKDANKENILKFAIKGLGTVATTLYKKVNDKQKENLKLLCKAYMAGRYEDIKFYQDDLDREIGMTLSEKQRELWRENIEKASHSNLQVKESYDFEKILRLGQKPDITCIDWNTGKSATTLLANFDTNKKIVCGYKNNKYIARAIIRITKLTNEYQDNRLAFKDIDVLDSLEHKAEETLALFIERPYDVELNDTEQKLMYQSFMHLALDKAKELNAVLVVAPEYNELVEVTFSKRASKIEYTQKYVFVSFSKNGEQYLDSLQGKATDSKEGTFIQNEFYIINP